LGSSRYVAGPRRVRSGRRLSLAGGLRTRSGHRRRRRDDRAAATSGPYDRHEEIPLCGRGTITVQRIRNTSARRTRTRGTDKWVGIRHPRVKSPSRHPSRGGEPA
jgi:hypothetical protein